MCCTCLPCGYATRFLIHCLLEQIRTVHACAPSDFKRVTTAPAGKKEWSSKDFANPLKRMTVGTQEVFGDHDESRCYSPKYIQKRERTLEELEMRARSLEAGELGRKRTHFIAKTRFFGAPDSIDIKPDGAISQRFPLKHPDIVPWRHEVYKPPKWAVNSSKVPPEQVGSTILAECVNITPAQSASWISLTCGWIELDSPALL